MGIKEDKADTLAQFISISEAIELIANGSSVSIREAADWFGYKLPESNQTFLYCRDGLRIERVENRLNNDEILETYLKVIMKCTENNSVSEEDAKFFGFARKKFYLRLSESENFISEQMLIESKSFLESESDPSAEIIRHLENQALSMAERIKQLEQEKSEISSKSGQPRKATLEAHQKLFGVISSYAGVTNDPPFSIAQMLMTHADLKGLDCPEKDFIADQLKLALHKQEEKRKPLRISPDPTKYRFAE